MVVIELQFPAGRYHATPWGRNVNEGEVEWPPSPFRLARALLDVWKRRKPDWREERVKCLLEALSAPVRFYLPPASAAHTRSYLSSNEKDPLSKQLIFDAFVALDRQAKVLMGYECDLAPEAIHDLSALLEELNYFGRSESWVCAKVEEEITYVEWNSISVPNDTAAQNSEIVRLACLASPKEYEESAYPASAGTWVQALCLTTRDLLNEGWSDPPALRWADFVRSKYALQPKPVKDTPPNKKRFCCAKYALSSKVLPTIKETVSFAERIRTYLMGIHRRVKNGNSTLVSPTFSGKEPNGKPLKDHKHAFFLPLDEDGDGRLDHLLVSAADPFNNSELTAIDRLRSVWQPDGRPDVQLVLVSLSVDFPMQRSKKWASATPFVTSRHYRKGRGTYYEWLAGEIAKECTFHNLPEPSTVEWIPHTLHTKRSIRWMEFTRSRKNKTPLRGHGCILGFDEPVKGPFAIGSGCHFGLGLFVKCEHA